jgi:transposase-like protein
LARGSRTRSGGGCRGTATSLDEVVIKIAGMHWLWRAVDQHGIVLDVGTRG